MRVSLEISMYPLDAHYGTPILKFIERLRQNENLEVLSNTMSTQIFGDYDTLMEALAKEMKQTFEEETTVVMVTKLVNADLRP